MRPGGSAPPSGRSQKKEKSGVAEATKSKACSKCQGKTFRRGTWVICPNDPAHNFNLAALVKCASCGARRDLVKYTSSVFCTGCGFTTVTKQVAKTGNKPGPAKAGVGARTPPKNKKAPKTDAAITEGNRQVEGNVETFYYKSTPMAQAKINATKRLRCVECGMKVAKTYGWGSVAVESGTKAEAEGTVSECVRSTCQAETVHVVVTLKKPKSGVKSEPVPTSKGVVTPPVRGATKAADISEEQVHVLFDANVKNLKLREKIAEAFRSANEGFRLAEPAKRKKLVNAAKKATLSLATPMPSHLNVRWKGVVRSVPMRWTVPRRGVLNPLWSVTLALIASSETSKLDQEDVALIQEAAYHSAILDNSLPTKKSKSKKAKTPIPKTEVTTAQVPMTEASVSRPSKLRWISIDEIPRNRFVAVDPETGRRVVVHVDQWRAEMLVRDPESFTIDELEPYDASDLYSEEMEALLRSTERENLTVDEDH